MPHLNYHDLYSRLSRKEVSSLYYFYGEEVYLQEDAVKRILRNAGIKIPSILFGSELDINDFVNFVSTGSLFAEKLLVLVKEADRIKVNLESKLAVFMENQHKDGQDSNIVVFVNPEKMKKSDVRKNQLIELAAKTGIAAEFPRLSGNEILRFIGKEITNNKKKISPDTAGYLYDMIGENLLEIKNEIDKLSLFVGTKEEITTKDINLCTEYLRSESIYRLSDAVLAGRKEEAMRLFNDLLSKKTELNHIISSVYYSFYYSLVNGGTRPSQDKAAQGRLVKKIEVLHKTDLAVKSGREIDLQFFISELCS